MMKRKSSKVKNYKKEVAVPETKEEMQEGGVILDINSLPLNLFSPDRKHGKLQMQELAIESQETQRFYVDFTALSLKRRFFSVNRFAAVFLGLHNKCSGVITITLRNHCYKDRELQVDMESQGRTGEMWGLCGSMSQFISVEDKDQLFLEITLSNLSTENVIVGNLMIMWGFEETDAPFSKIPIPIMKFVFPPITNETDPRKVSEEIRSAFYKIAERKKDGVKSFRDILTANKVTVSANRTLNIDPCLPNIKAIDLNADGSAIEGPSTSGISMETAFKF